MTMKRSHLSLTFLLKEFCASVIAILVMQTEVLATNSFQQALQLANSLKGKSQEAVTKFNPQETFKNQKGGYTEAPPQMGYYKDVTQPNAFDLEKAAHKEILQDEPVTDKNGKPIPTPGKVVAEGFQKREVYKINQEAEFMQKGKLITSNAQNIVMGESNKNIDCETQKLAACKTVQVEETCNEEVRTVQRACEKIPVITIKDETYQEPQTHSGSISATGPRSGTFTVPVSGSITSFVGTIGLPGIFNCPYTGSTIGLSLNGCRFSLVSTGCGDNPVWNFGKDNLDVPVTAYVPVSLVIDECSTNSPHTSCNWWRGCAGWDGDRNRCAVWRNIDWRHPTYTVVVRANLTKKVASLESWQETCHDT